jgi:hypothetical protein
LFYVYFLLIFLLLILNMSLIPSRSLDARYVSTVCLVRRGLIRITQFPSNKINTHLETKNKTRKSRPLVSLVFIIFIGTFTILLKKLKHKKIRKKTKWIWE